MDDMHSDENETTPNPAPRSLRQAPPIRTQHELERQWRALVGEHRCTTERLWLLLLGPDGRPAGELTVIDEVPPVPDAGVDALMEMFAVLLADFEGASLAVLRSRPGPAGLTTDDLAWAGALLDGAAAHGVPTWPVHVATDEAVVVVPPDALSGRTA